MWHLWKNVINVTLYIYQLVQKICLLFFTCKIIRRFQILDLQFPLNCVTMMKSLQNCHMCFVLFSITQNSLWRLNTRQNVKSLSPGIAILDMMGKYPFQVSTEQVKFYKLCHIFIEGNKVNKKGKISVTSFQGKFKSLPVSIFLQ